MWKKGAVGGLMVLMILIVGCIEHQPQDTRYIPEPVVQPIVKEKQLKGLRVYEGKVPCPDCPVVEQRLALKGDTAGIFRLTETFKESTEDGDNILVTTGEWKRYKANEGDNQLTIFYLSEGHISDSTRVQRYAVAEDRIVQLDIQGARIPQPEAYTLKLIRKEN